jgi:hypothetical protein
MRACLGMMDRRRMIEAATASLLLTTFMTAPVSAQDQATPTAQTVPPVLLSYIYGHAPIVMETTRAIAMAVHNANEVETLAPINQLAGTNALPTPQSKLIVRANADTQARLNLEEEPIILHLPDTRARYHLTPFLDAYTSPTGCRHSPATFHSI